MVGGRGIRYSLGGFTCETNKSNLPMGRVNVIRTAKECIDTTFINDKREAFVGKLC